ncbi:ATP-dependent Clp protease proteolytic subunit [Enterobacter asburiae]|uniref:ATP-dependent Clp protease proteolytic subunit n=1 Tax=Enterobacter asburiae TaxID=61645 RepID=UPI00192AA2B5|nr:ATP-dependent Clp protease proteolytic subunit [Enterobacter asburiae]MBL5840936.1 ATP-dependent Clp protease proteolytic subunit [Enterobacter asburiae]
MEHNKNFFGMMPGMHGNIYSYPVHSHDHVIYIDDLSWLEDHQDRLQVIRQASPDDTIRVVINSPGGVVSIAMAYVSAIRESQASIVTHAEGNVCSAGTVLWLACKDRTVSPLTEFMFHNYQGGTYGDGANMYAQIAFEKHYFDRLIDTFYSGVLTETEIATIKGGGQVWMDEVEIVKRTPAVLLDERNIKRMQEGQRPIISGEKAKEPKDKTVIENVDLDNLPEGTPESIFLKIEVEGEVFKFDVSTLQAKDFDPFNVAELQTIYSQIGAMAIGAEDPLVVNVRNRQELIDAILAASEEIMADVLERMGN